MSNLSLNCWKFKISTLTYHSAFELNYEEIDSVIVINREYYAVKEEQC